MHANCFTVYISLLMHQAEETPQWVTVKAETSTVEGNSARSGSSSSGGGGGSGDGGVGRSKTPGLPSWLAQPDEVGEKTFEQFAMVYFSDMTGGNYAHQTAQLHAPLLNQVWGDGDSHRVLVTWSALLFFLGDTKLHKKEYTIDIDVGELDNGRRTPSQHLFGSHSKTMKVAVTNLDAVAIITGTGLKREKTRDEIYCQICKQLVDNPNRYSHARAWIMLALCAGVFLPSPAFEKVLRNFIKNTGPPGYLPYLMQRFARAETAFQPRTHTVSSVEVHSAFTGEKIQIRVHFYFSSMVVLADGATTPAEVVASVKRHPDLAEEYGFKLFILGKEATTVGTQISRMDAFECVPGKFYKSSSVLWRAYIFRDIYRLQPRVTTTIFEV